jgi:hypothetical protein
MVVVVVVVVVGTGAGAAEGGATGIDDVMLGGAAGTAAIPGANGRRFCAFADIAVETTRTSAMASGATNATIPAPALKLALVLMSSSLSSAAATVRDGGCQPPSPLLSGRDAIAPVQQS